MEQHLESWSDDRRVVMIRTWLRLWVPWCELRADGADPFDVDLVRFSNFLAAVQEDTEDGASAFEAQHARFKVASAAVNGVWMILGAEDSARKPIIARLAKRNRRVAPMKTKHSDTWDVAVVLNFLVDRWRTGMRAESMPESALRATTEFLLRLCNVSRSADVSTLTVEWFEGVEGPHLCLAGDRARGIINKVRWWRDKNQPNRIGNYSHFMVVLPARATPTRPELEAVCLRTTSSPAFDALPPGAASTTSFSSRPRPRLAPPPTRASSRARLPRTSRG